MRRILIILFLIIIKVHASHAQISFTTTTVPSSCSANGSITVNVSGGNSPFYYQIISSTSGVIRPVQNVNIFNNLPGGTYNIRVTDNNNQTVTNTAVVGGNYIPLAFTYTQQQSTIFINPLNGKPPYKFTYSSDGGLTYLPPKDSNSFNCLGAGKLFIQDIRQLQ